MDYSMKEEIIERAFEKVKHSIVPSETNNYKSKFLQSNILLYCVVLLLILKIVAILVSINIPQNIFFADITKSALENYVNKTRQSLGLNSLSENEKLAQAAQLKAENMVQDQYFNHTSPSGVTPWFWFVKSGYNYKFAGENLAVGFFDSQEVYNAWLNSPSHKANILNPNYTEVGTAVLNGLGPNNSIVVVQEFGSPLPVKQIAAKNTATKQVAIHPKAQTITPKAAPVVNTQPKASTQPSNEKVLSQTTESPNVLESPRSTGVSNLPSKVLNSVLYNYDGLLQEIAYGLSSIVMGILVTLIFFNFRINFKRELVFRAALIMVLLTAATLLNRGMIISFIPHQIAI
jgi:uncharacterized protein YkwD